MHSDASDDAPADDPHASQPVRHAGAPLDDADAVMVMLHGRGGTAEGMLDLAPMLERDRAATFAYLAPQASGNTWYPHSFLVPWRQNEPHVSSALRAVGEVMRRVGQAGVPRERVMLLGFSQGACLASEFAARHPTRYGGIAILTGGLIGDRVDPAGYEGSFECTPVLLCSGDPDPHVPWARVGETAEVYRALDADLTVRRYPGRPHSVSQDEIERVQRVMNGM